MLFLVTEHKRHVITRNIPGVPKDVSCDIPIETILEKDHRLNETPRRVLTDMVLLWGLFYAVDERRPMPYSARFCAPLPWVGPPLALGPVSLACQLLAASRRYKAVAGLLGAGAHGD
jgi:hypothetical protein